jgi:hypothetical protein
MNAYIMKYDLIIGFVILSYFLSLKPFELITTLTYVLMDNVCPCLTMFRFVIMHSFGKMLYFHNHVKLNSNLLKTVRCSTDLNLIIIFIFSADCSCYLNNKVYYTSSIENTNIFWIKSDILFSIKKRFSMRLNFV